ncbi:hypothetical protein K0504_16240 [Neiella marina]|uniref:Dinitrogenase iron-molybdenum cofactor biosynthesis domain-containing protein n=1 Tax=Neiella holothuriorum TaxID=2870530 RepID=A0ABS7EJS7_9GAMM|nr:NifB/NifX family molybdenum-iron cluster-binding protein [Neiella holothuriorum]MBW8192589.1 hypothetical protein [Neiella holothuriorum]
MNSAPQRKLQLIDRAAHSFWFHVAFATNDQEHINQHFGSCKALAVYGLDDAQAGLVEVIQFNPTIAGHDQGKLMARYQALENCAAVYCNAIGPSAVGHLLATGVQPVKVSAGMSIHQALIELHQQLLDGPRGWLAKAMKHQDSNTSHKQQLNALLDDEW